jgi:hypothetical protein
VHVRADVTGVKRGHINVLDDARRCRGHTHATPVSKRSIALNLKSFDLCTKQTHRILNIKRRDTEATEMRRQTRFIELDPIPVKVSAERHEPILPGPARPVRQSVLARSARELLLVRRRPDNLPRRDEVGVHNKLAGGPKAVLAHLSDVVRAGNGRQLKRTRVVTFNRDDRLDFDDHTDELHLIGHRAISSPRR